LKKLVISTVLAGIAILIINQVFSILLQNIFAYNVLTLAGMRNAMADPIMILFFVHPFVVALVMAIVYNSVKKAFNGTSMQKGINYGLTVFAVSAIPSAFMVYSSMDYPIGFTLSTILGPLVYMLSAGIIIAKIMD